MLAASLVPTTYVGHPFWQEPDPSQARQQRTHFLKNLGLLGGLLLAAVDTEGQPGLAYRAAHGRRVRQAAPPSTTKRETKHVARAARREARHAAPGCAPRGQAEPAEPRRTMP